jgi:hypothetical protein
MTYSKKGIPALIVTCAFATFAIVAIPTHAMASSYYNYGVDVSGCIDIFCDDRYNYGDMYGGNMYLDEVGFGFYSGDPVAYSYPEYYSYPVYGYSSSVASTYPPAYSRSTYYYTQPLRYRPTPAQEFAQASREFDNNLARSAAAWNNYANYYAAWPL